MSVWEQYLDKLDQRQKLINKVCRWMMVCILLGIFVWCVIDVWPESRLKCAPSNNYSGCDENIYDCTNIDADGITLTVSDSSDAIQIISSSGGLTFESCDTSGDFIVIE